MDITPYDISKKSHSHTHTNFFSIEESSSISIDMHRSHHQQSHTSTSRSSDSNNSSNADDANKWAAKLLRDCAAAISERDSAKIHHLLWMLNELASPYGDSDQKLASYFSQALFCKATESGNRCYKTLSSVARKNHSFNSARRLILRFQEVSPWTTFGHVSSNGAILEALEGELKLHIIDVSHTLCTQWPTLLEALATRNAETPKLKLTVVTLTETLAGSVMKEVGLRMEKFARLMGVPFEFNVVSNRLTDLTREVLGIHEDEAVAVNCIGALRRVEVEERENVIRVFKSLNPRVITVVEEEADFCSTRDNFLKCFDECLKFYSLYFEMLEESFSVTSNEKLMLERECFRSIVRVLACDDQLGDDDGGGYDFCERRERGTQWCERLKSSFSPVGFSDDVSDDVKALLKRYRNGWSLLVSQSQGDGNNNSNSNSNNFSGIYLTWKEEPVVWASAWKP